MDFPLGHETVLILLILKLLRMFTDVHIFKKNLPCTKVRIKWGGGKSMSYLSDVH